MSALPQPKANPAAKLDVGRAIEVGFRLLGWSAVTLLATAGLFVLVFFALGNFTLEGFFLQVANLADRYGVADPTRRVAFQDDLRLVSGIALSATMFLRRASLGQVFSSEAGE
ncbi:MAG: hypothetical protein H0X36_00715 [Sphingomonadaceae bacterium]|nr:hypothetical protein [Sphingomonadaceae bacterium]